MPACNLTALTKGTVGNTCGTYTPAGVSDRIYIFDVDDVDDTNLEPGNDGFYDAGVFAGVDLFAIDIKTDSGKVTSSKSEDDESRSLVATAVINYAFDKFMPIDTAIAFMNVGVIVPIDGTKAYVIMSPYRRTKYTCEFDSGDTYDSDHGFTITFTCSPVLYACPMVKIGSSGLNLSSANTTYDSTQYTADSVTGVTNLTVTGDGTVTVGNEITLTAETTPAGKEVRWTSSNTSKATVTSSGVVKGVAAGTVTITAKSGTFQVDKVITVSAS